MSNKYLYLSSLNSNNHADFEVSLPSQVTINPYSEIRVVSAKLSPNPDQIGVKDSNNTFYVGCDNWMKRHCVMPLLPVILDEDGYEVTTNDFSNEIQEKVEKALQPYCLVRGGCTVSSTDRKLKMQLSTMEVYGCPTIALTEDVYNFWLQNGDNRYPKLIKKGDQFINFYPVQSTENVQLNEEDTYYGMAINKMGKQSQYYTSPPLVTGLSGRVEAQAHLNHVVECDFTNFNPPAEEDELGGFRNPNHYVRFYFGGVEVDDLGKNGLWGSEVKSNVDVSEDLSTKYIYSLEFSTARVNLRYNVIGADEVTATVEQVKGAQGGGVYGMNNKFKFELSQYEDQYRSYFVIKVQIYVNGAWANLFDDLTIPALADRHYDHGNNHNRIGIEFYTPNATDALPEQMENMIRYTAAVDDVADVNGFVDGAFKAKTSQSADVANRLLTIVTDYDDPGKIRSAMFDAMNSNNLIDSTDIFDMDYELTGDEPNADMLEFSPTDFAYTSTSNTGITAQDAIETDLFAFENLYISCPSLPLENVSGYANGGGVNQILCQIDLEESGTDTEVLSSRPSTEQYNTCHNSYPLRLNTIRMRIIDIEGNVTNLLEENTNIVLEIRDNIHMKKMEYMNNIKLLVDNYSKMQPLVQDQ